jgi:hypothetical protein
MLTLASICIVLAFQHADACTMNADGGGTASVTCQNRPVMTLVVLQARMTSGK